MVVLFVFVCVSILGTDMGLLYVPVVLIVVYFVCSMCAGCLVQVFSSCIAG